MDADWSRLRDTVRDLVRMPDLEVVGGGVFVLLEVGSVIVVDVEMLEDRVVVSSSDSDSESVDDNVIDEDCDTDTELLIRCDLVRDMVPD